MEFSGKAAAVLIALLITSQSIASPQTGTYDRDLIQLLELARKNPPDPPVPSESLYLKNEILLCTGTLKAAVENNRAAALMENGDFKQASLVLEEALKHSPLFLPYRYNLGLCYLYLRDYRRSLLHLNKALLLAPEFPATYLQIGFVHERLGVFTEAIDYFKMALTKNSGELMTFIRIGDLFFKRGQYEMAKKYYSASLKINPAYSNGLIGLAKILFKREEYIKALTQLKTVDTRGEYDKSYHYYFAEINFKLQEYADAAYHYSELLKYKNDKFFLTNSFNLIEHKLRLSRRFSE